MFIRGNTKEFTDLYGIKNLYANGKQIHLDNVRWLFQSANNLINNENMLLVDDDLKNLKLAREHGHYAFQITSSTQLNDFLSYLKTFQ